MFQNALLEGFFLLEYVNYGTMLKIMIMNILYVVNLFMFNNLWFYILSPCLSLMVATIYLDFKIRHKIIYSYRLPTKNILKDVCFKSYEFFKIGLITSLNSFLPRCIVVYLSPTIEYVAILDVINKITLSIINFFSTISRPIYALASVKANSVKSKLVKIELVYLVVGLLFLLSIWLFQNYIVDYFFNKVSLSAGYLIYLLILYSLAAILYLLGQPLSLYLMGIGENKRVFNTLLISLISFVAVYFMQTLICQGNVLFMLSIANLVLAIIYYFMLFYNCRKC